jgi:hypothetical protein
VHLRAGRFSGGIQPSDYITRKASRFVAIILSRLALGLERYRDGSHTVILRSIAQLAVIVRPPAVYVADGGQAARVRAAGRHRFENKSARRKNRRWNIGGCVRLSCRNRINAPPPTMRSALPPEAATERPSGR